MIFGRTCRAWPVWAGGRTRSKVVVIKELVRPDSRESAESQRQVAQVVDQGHGRVFVVCERGTELAAWRGCRESFGQGLLHGEERSGAILDGAIGDGEGQV